MNLWSLLVFIRPWIVWVFVVVIVGNGNDTVVKAFTPQHRGECRFFLNTANEKEWDELLCTGLFHGITTNPTLLQQANQPCTIKNIHRMSTIALEMVQEIILQTWGSTMEELYETGMALSSPCRDRIVIQIPITTLHDVHVATKLIQSGCRVCLLSTLLCPDQEPIMTSMLSIGAEYISLYLGGQGRQFMNDHDDNFDGRDVSNNNDDDILKEFMEVIDMINNEKQDEARFLVENIQSVHILTKLASNNMETFSISPDVSRDLIADPLTDKVAIAFEKAAQQ